MKTMKIVAGRCQECDAIVGEDRCPEWCDVRMGTIVFSAELSATKEELLDGAYVNHTVTDDGRSMVYEATDRLGNVTRITHPHGGGEPIVKRDTIDHSNCVDCSYCDAIQRSIAHTPSSTRWEKEGCAKKGCLECQAWFADNPTEQTTRLPIPEVTFCTGCAASCESCCPTVTAKDPNEPIPDWVLEGRLGPGERWNALWDTRVGPHKEDCQCPSCRKKKYRQTIHRNAHWLGATESDKGICASLGCPQCDRFIDRKPDPMVHGLPMDRDWHAGDVKRLRRCGCAICLEDVASLRLKEGATIKEPHAKRLVRGLGSQRDSYHHEACTCQHCKDFPMPKADDMVDLCDDGTKRRNAYPVDMALHGRHCDCGRCLMDRARATLKVHTDAVKKLYPADMQPHHRNCMCRTCLAGYGLT